MASRQSKPERYKLKSSINTRIGYTLTYYLYRDRKLNKYRQGAAWKFIRPSGKHAGCSFSFLYISCKLFRNRPAGASSYFSSFFFPSLFVSSGGLFNLLPNCFSSSIRVCCDVKPLSVGATMLSYGAQQS